MSKQSVGNHWLWIILMGSDLTLGPSIRVKQRQPNLKVLITHLLLVLEVCNVKTNL